jgi:MarR-like DNA-binding transcriptional regulator SgrR of sgrS sRNA
MHNMSAIISSTMEKVSCETDESVNQLHPQIVDLWMDNEGIQLDNKVDCWYILQSEPRSIRELHESPFQSKSIADEEIAHNTNVCEHSCT